MASTPKIKYLRHRTLDGLERGAPDSPRLRKFQNWLNRKGFELPAQGGLAGTESPIVVTFAASTNRVHHADHGYTQGEEILLKGGVLPGGLTRAAQSTGTVTLSAQPSGGDYLDVDDARYIFRSSVDHAIANEIQVGSSLAVTVGNIGRAVNGGMSGNSVSATTMAHPTVEQLSITGAVLTLEARTVGDIDIALDTDATGITVVDITGGSGRSYFVIRVNNALFNLATTHERALHGTVKSFQSNGSGTTTAERVVDSQEILDLLRYGIPSTTIEFVNDIDDL